MPPEDEEKTRLKTQVEQLQELLAQAQLEAIEAGNRLALQADKYQLELELLRKAQKLVAEEVARLHEAPLGAAPVVNKSGYLGGDPLPEQAGRLGVAPRTGGFMGTPTPANAGGYLGGDTSSDDSGYLGAPAQRTSPNRQAPPPPSASANPTPEGWLGSPDDEPWDGYVRPNYTKAGLPPGAAGAAKLAARSANQGKSVTELPPLDLEAPVEGVSDSSDWLAGPDTAEIEEVPDWLTAEKPE